MKKAAVFFSRLHHGKSRFGNGKADCPPVGRKKPYAEARKGLQKGFTSLPLLQGSEIPVVPEPHGVEDTAAALEEPDARRISVF